MNEEVFFVCPYCLETISVLVDLSAEGPVQYVEDCEVCCHPIAFRYQVTGNALQNFQASRLD
jgi:hypothetical protein